ncbi:MAG TPA: DNA phosphorothioation-associated putative methyltransferase, partial [Acidimicrobiales bacterium]
MSRTALSRPVALALEDEVISLAVSVFDYGSGRGGDLHRLSSLGVIASGWDPTHAPDEERKPADVVNIGYVINVIEDPNERRQALTEAWRLAKRALVVSARPAWEERGLSARPRGDGWVTSSGTFQKFYEQEELRAWIDDTLGVQSVAAAPCIFYCFRDPRDAQGFRARQVRRTGIPRQRVSEALFEAHRDLLEELCAFVDDRGRLPERNELSAGPEIVKAFGSLRNAFSVVRRVTGDDRWAMARDAAEKNVLVYLALSAFGGRPRMSDLPDDVQRDIRYLFGSYKAATNEADRLLFAAGRQEDLDAAIRAASIGKVLPDAFYVHVSALADLPPVLRVYEGCAQVIVGAVGNATIVKLQRVERKVAYLAYPAFDREGHPALVSSLRADLRTFDVKWTDFQGSGNPPILHRKELFVSPGYPGYQKFSRLSAQEERAGLLSSPGIGTRRLWNELLEVGNLRVVGHRLLRGAE